MAATALELPEQVLARLPQHVPGLVVDVGAGNGWYTRTLRLHRPDLRVLAVDLSPGMAAIAGTPAVVANALRLPLVDRCAGAVLAMHMLYHVPDPDLALAELARVRAPGGLVFIATNAAGDKDELDELRRVAVRDVTGRDLPLHLVDDRFTVDVGQAMAREHFGQVERIDFVGELVVPQVEPVVDFVRSIGAANHPSGVAFDQVLTRVRVRVAATIQQHGAFRITSRSGMLVCR